MLQTATVSAVEDLEVLMLTQSRLHQLMDEEVIDKECVAAIRETAKQQEEEDQILLDKATCSHSEKKTSNEIRPVLLPPRSKSGDSDSNPF